MGILERLLTDYKVTDIIILLFLIAFGIKEVVSLVDYYKARGKAKLEKEAEPQNIEQKLMDKLEDLEGDLCLLNENFEDSTKKINDTMKEHQKTLDLLIASDRDDIRAYLVRQHHYFTEKGYIDDFSLDVLEKRYAHYKAEGGNTYVSDLMHDIRQLKKVSIVTSAHLPIHD